MTGRSGEHTEEQVGISQLLGKPVGQHVGLTAPQQRCTCQRNPMYEYAEMLGWPVRKMRATKIRKILTSFIMCCFTAH